MEIWFYIALLAPALFALINIIDDNLLRSVYRTPFFGAIISGFFALLPLVAVLFVPITIPSLPIIVIAMLSGVLTVSYYVLYFKGLSVEAPSVVISIFSLAPAFLPFIAYFLLGERLTSNQYLGFAFLLFASIGISAVDIKKFKFSPALYPIAFASFLYAVISILQKYVYNTVDFWSGYIFFVIGMGLGALLLSLVFKEGRNFYKEFRKVFKKWILVFFLVELLGIAAEFSYNYALSLGPVSLVKVIEGIQPIYVLLFAILFFPIFPKYFREATHDGKGKKIFFMLLMLAGLYIINT